MFIACLERLGDIYYTEYIAERYHGHSGTHYAQATTDNQGNTYIINKHYTSKFPGCCLTMELVDRLTKADLYLRVEHRDRTLNVWADQLAALDATGFNPARRWRPKQPLQMFDTTYQMAIDMKLHLPTDTKRKEYLLQQHETRTDKTNVDQRPKTKWIKRGHDRGANRVVILMDIRRSIAVRDYGYTK